jgi:hypothetical protein
MLGTANEMVVCPNQLIVGSTNILTTIINSINSIFLSSNSFSGNNTFNGITSLTRTSVTGISTFNNDLYMQRNNFYLGRYNPNTSFNDNTNSISFDGLSTGIILTGNSQISLNMYPSSTIAIISISGIIIKSGNLIIGLNTLTESKIGNIDKSNLFLFNGVSKSTEDPTITPTNISVGYNTTSLLTTGRTNTVFGQNCLSLITSSSKNVAIGSDIMQSFNPTGADGGNIGIGRTIMQALKTGTFNVGIGLNVLQSITNTSYNSAIGINAGSGVFGNYCSFLGVSTGQTVGNRLDYSTAIGAGALINSSNQIMLGTAAETVVCPNILVVGSTNIITTISTSISTAINNLIQTGAHFTGSNTFDYMIVDKFFCNNPIYFVNSNTTFTRSQFSVNQYIEIIDNGSTANPATAFYLTLPDPTTCQNQTVYIFCNNGNALSYSIINQTGNASFVGRYPNTGKTYTPGNGQTIIMISNYYNWVIM